MLQIGFSFMAVKIIRLVNFTQVINFPILMRRYLDYL
jgi:hypothetical protein